VASQPGILASMPVTFPSIGNCNKPLVCRDTKRTESDQTDAAIWQEVRQLLEELERLEQEYRQRLQPLSQSHEQEGLDA
jgi:hypothetical protein